MDTWIIQLKDPKALKLLLDLEELQLIRLVEKTMLSTEKLSEKYRGKLPANEGEALQQHIQQSREEWENRI
ncbi:MAG: hypothetical protein KDD10_23170 [Phaeodactylibacter sp.]|nr:hypothetical protein [Phaeodactylibacter sp.]MCB9292523.1 hypothetical protein [Lewinellaceae bacterium]